MRKYIIPVVICCLCTILCVITIIFLFFLYPQNSDRIQSVALFVDIIISVATICSTIGAFVIAIKSPDWIKDANKTDLVLDIKNMFPYRNKTDIREIKTSIRPELVEDSNGFRRPKQVKEEYEVIYETFFIGSKLKILQIILLQMFKFIWNI